MRHNISLRALLAIAIAATLPSAIHAQARPAPAGTTAAPTTIEVAETRDQLMAYLHESPTLREVVATDPSLLADQAYIARTNPQLSDFLVAHPEVARNPDFYLFADIPSHGEHHSDRLERRTGQEISSEQELARMRQRSLDGIAPVVVFFAFTVGALWLARMLLENRRWNKAFHVQTDVHARLMDRFGSSEDLIRYMQSEPGRRFLEASPISVGIDTPQRWPGTLSRVLGPLQLGIVLTLLGVGFLVIRNSLVDITEPRLVFGIVALMPGLGFILSAGVTWWMSSRLGLISTGSENQQ